VVGAAEVTWCGLPARGASAVRRRRLRAIRGRWRWGVPCAVRGKGSIFLRRSSVAVRLCPARRVSIVSHRRRQACVFYNNKWNVLMPRSRSVS
jgi:hypothetical protein